MIRFKFDVLAEEIPGFDGLSVGDAVIPVKQLRIDLGGYQYDTWKRLDNGVNVDVRTRHRGKFREIVIECEHESEIAALVDAECEKVKADA